VSVAFNTWVVSLLLAVSQGAAPRARAVQTGHGAMVIRDVQRGERGPVECEVGLPFCRQAKAGMQIITIRLAPSDGTSLDSDSAVDLISQAVLRKDSDKVLVYLLTSNGTAISSDLGAVERNNVAFGIATPARVRLVSSVDATGIGITFEVPAGATKLQFVWPGNPPVPLD
jgi:hypothetical protein